MNEIDPRISKSYREGATDEPPVALDAAILTAARGRVAQPRRRAASPWWRWMAPAGALATLALGVALALLVERDQPQTGADLREAPEPKSPALAPRLPEPAPAPAPPEASARTRDSAVKAVPAVRPQPAAAADAAASAAKPAEAAAETFPAQSRAKASAPAASAPKAAADANAEAEPRAAGAPAAGAAATGAVQHSPEAWLEQIRRLKLEGREQEAAAQLAQFRLAFPAYALPQDLGK